MKLSNYTIEIPPRSHIPVYMGVVALVCLSTAISAINRSEREESEAELTQVQDHPENYDFLRATELQDDIDNRNNWAIPFAAISAFGGIGILTYAASRIRRREEDLPGYVSSTSDLPQKTTLID